MIKFTLQPPERTQELRKEFDHKNMNHKFIKWLYRKGFLNKYADIISLERARRGRMPRGFDVHHIIPLSGGGTNHVSNMCLIEQSFHKFLNKKCFDPALRSVKLGQTVELDIPELPKVALRRDFMPFIERKLKVSKDRAMYRRFFKQ